MKLKAKEFKFNGNKIKTRPIEYTINWSDFIGEPTVTISRFDSTFGRDNQLRFSAKDIPFFIKELQTLTEFMKNDGLLVEHEEEEAQDEDR
jgi:hypothetical protein